MRDWRCVIRAVSPDPSTYTSLLKRSSGLQLAPLTRSNINGSFPLPRPIVFQGLINWGEVVALSLSLNMFRSDQKSELMKRDLLL